MKILLTTTSFQDTPGKHQDLLYEQGYEIDTLRGPVKAEVLSPIISQYDGIICGDDEINEDVIRAGKNGKLKVISKYGIGLDKIDLDSAKKYGVPVTNCPGVNHITVAEHVFALILSFLKNICLEYNITNVGGWERLIGHEIYGKTIGIIGLGRIGKEVAIRSKAFGLKVIANDFVIDEIFNKEHEIHVSKTIEEIFEKSDIVTLHMNLTKENRKCISIDLIINHCKKGLILVNTARGELVDLDGIIYGIENKIIGGYLTDVLDSEPMPKNYPLTNYDNVIITPHIGSRTFESVERQGLMTVNNLIHNLIL